MRALVQRVKNARVVVEGRDSASIARGLLVFVGVGRGDREEDIARIAKKVAGLRIFEDEVGKMNLSVQEVKGEVLSVPQFTLYADTRKGNRPGFEFSADPKTAKDYWERLNSMLKEMGLAVKEGVFGAHMEVELVNDGPVTIWLDSQATS
jgi:D-tyrosyl-tRNA(Tyr) deacylase